ncbi:MAG: helix-turn-helix domain-containing protein [Cyclobacteriaceae bacterium]
MEDYLKELGHLGLIARLKRLSDSMLYSIRDVYKVERFEIEPNWHFVFLSLKKHGKRTMTELSESFGLSQPATVKIINKMKKKGYIDVVVDSSDSRKKQLQLSEKAKTELPQFERVWIAGQASITDMLKGDTTFLSKLEELESLLKDQRFEKRILNHLKS